MTNELKTAEDLAAKLSRSEQLKLIEFLAQNLARNMPEPAKWFKGRPVYTKAQLREMDNPLPDESEWVAELKKKHSIT